MVHVILPKFQLKFYLSFFTFTDSIINLRSTMDVTNDNFSDLIPEIESKIAGCSFISFDLEFTGIYTKKTNSYLDTLEQFYVKCRNNVKQFQIFQVGLSFFKLITENEFDCHSYNFYIFPKPCSLLPPEESERYFLSQTSSLIFLAENGFDFNKLINGGISYLNFSQEKFIKNQLEISTKKVSSKEIDEAMGFTTIIKLIIKSKKPLVGHNCKLDIFYLYQTFIGSLPESYFEFKNLFHNLFPSIFDTRFISSRSIFAKLIPNKCK